MYLYVSKFNRCTADKKEFLVFYKILIYGSDIFDIRISIHFYFIGTENFFFHTYKWFMIEYL